MQHLIQRKFVLEKFAKMNNIEQYTLYTINEYYKMYCKILDDAKGKDIDYPDYKLNFKAK